MKDKDEWLKNILKVLVILIPLAFLTQKLGLSEINLHVWYIILSYILTTMFIYHFGKYIQSNMHQYSLSTLTAMIVYLTVEFTINKYIYIFYILIILFVLFALVIYLTFKSKNPP